MALLIVLLGGFEEWGLRICNETRRKGKEGAWLTLKKRLQAGCLQA
jgi:hypothetical protein